MQGKKYNSALLDKQNERLEKVTKEELTKLLRQKLHFQIFIKPLFEKYFQVVNAFHCFVKNRFSISLNRNSRQIFNNQNFYPVSLPFYLTAKFKLRRVRIAQRKTIHFHDMDQIGTLVCSNHIR